MSIETKAVSVETHMVFTSMFLNRSLNKAMKDTIGLNKAMVS